MKGIPEPLNSHRDCHGDLDSMSGGERTGLPHQLPPTVAQPNTQYAHIRPNTVWPNTVGGIFGGGHWVGGKPGGYLPGGYTGVDTSGYSPAQTETIDLSAPRQEPIRNGDNTPINGQVKEVSVIAANPLRGEEGRSKKDDEEDDSGGGAASRADQVESLLENMFETGGSAAPTSRSVIVRPGPPALTQDRVVAILEDKLPVRPVKESPPQPPPSPPPPPPNTSDTPMEVAQEDIKKEPCPTIESGDKEGEEEGEGGGGLVVEEEKEEEAIVKVKKEEETETPFNEVESELEKMFAGIVEPTDDSSSKSAGGGGGGPTQAKGKRGRKKGRPEGSKNKKLRNKRHRSDSKAAKKAKREKASSNDTLLSTGVGRVRGPYLKIKGLKENPVSVTVVNSGLREEEETMDKPTIPRRKALHHSEGRLKGPGLYNSTLSARYNSNHVDPTWVCVFCKKRPHCDNGLGENFNSTQFQAPKSSVEPAGDLFGPYMLKIPQYVGESQPTDSEVAEEQKRRGGGRQLSLRTAGIAQQFANNYNKKSKGVRGLEKEDEGGDKGGVEEVWVHEQCAVWAPGVLLVGPHLIGLDEAVSLASNTRCSLCGVEGAGLGCVVRGCHASSHYGCALLASWHLDHDTFIAKCPIHNPVRQEEGGYMTLEMLKSGV